MSLIILFLLVIFGLVAVYFLVSDPVDDKRDSKQIVLRDDRPPKESSSPVRKRTVCDLRKDMMYQIQNQIVACMTPLHEPFVVRRNYGDYIQPQPVYLKPDCFRQPLRVVGCETLGCALQEAYGRCRPPDYYLDNEGVVNGNFVLDKIMDCLEFSNKVNVAYERIEI